MDDNELKKVFAYNLNNLLETNRRTQKEVADSIGVLPSTFNTWCTGAALPRMGKIQLLADYFGVMKSDLLGDAPAAPSLSAEEEAHLSCFRRLDQEDRLKVQGFTEALLLGEKYTKKGAAGFSA